MFGPKISTVFRSRWNALFWSAGVLLTAYCSVPSADDSDQGGQPAKTQQHVNPWAKTAK
ncbi:hypothetical protein [Novosphingobium album (ex Liu et al. 2023)]|uniref:Uncharacterized protein n=1 Tax=Novosphingobium album (ex Liu et al. 2023) TaxID=3031130 RepID=A0ABT5WNK7_9SPHN|nr:hypothetical protein [Novosphingobium album (ex Liu et al. 2023)]MDE8651617.1 hypothetical protein [Novosphingobium album (ex Liu et al. 2023)]